MKSDVGGPRGVTRVNGTNDGEDTRQSCFDYVIPSTGDSPGISTAHRAGGERKGFTIHRGLHPILDAVTGDKLSPFRYEC